MNMRATYDTHRSDTARKLYTRGSTPTIIYNACAVNVMIIITDDRFLTSERLRRRTRRVFARTE